VRPHLLTPSCPLETHGLATYQLFLRGTLDKIGAYADMMHIGEYKTAVNQLTQKGYTPAHREMDTSLKLPTCTNSCCGRSPTAGERARPRFERLCSTRARPAGRGAAVRA